MSSACVCHIEGDFCFYCEIYSPLERKHEIQTGEIQRVIAELERESLVHAREYMDKRNNERQYHLGMETGLDLAIDKLKEVLNTEANNPDRGNTAELEHHS